MTPAIFPPWSMHIGWLALGGTLLVGATVIVRSFARELPHLITASEVELIESSWLRTIADTVPISRQLETTGANQGLATLPP